MVKSPGEDNINTEDTRHAPVDLLQFLSNICTRMNG